MKINEYIINEANDLVSANSTDMSGTTSTAYFLSQLMTSTRSHGISDAIVCKDGFSISIQASAGHYCTPRNNTGPWEEVELGFPNRTPPDYILKYMEDLGNGPTESVYAYVPIDLVIKMIDEHGGPVGTDPRTDYTDGEVEKPPMQLKSPFNT